MRLWPPASTLLSLAGSASNRTASSRLDGRTYSNAGGFTGLYCIRRLRFSRSLTLSSALFLCALTLRPQIIGVAPLFPLIQQDLHLPHTVVGLLGTVPVLCMGVFAPLAPFLRHRLRTLPAITASLALIALFGLTRSLTPGALVLVLLTFGVGAGIGLGGALLPVAVKEQFPDQSVRTSGIYASGIQLGSTISAAAAVPLAIALGGWRSALLAFSLATAALTIAWVGLTRSASREAAANARPRFAFNNPIAWRLALAFALFGIFYYGLSAWLTAAYVARGWSLPQAAGLVAVVNAGSLVGSVLLPVFARRIASRSRTGAMMAATLVVASLGIAAVPALAFLWAGLAGLANGALFPLIIALPVEASEQPDEVGAISGVMLGAGYTLAAIAPSGFGAIRDLTGSFTPILWLIVVAAVLLLATSLSFDGIRRPRYY
ncbi:MAG: MFS transporter [Chloroflexi bacterium]|nr:MAG: MFS transporter [Chloroflexota bacterium]